MSWTQFSHFTTSNHILPR